MKTAGIIVEYNPLHKGHAYQIEQTRRAVSYTHLILSMSISTTYLRGIATGAIPPFIPRVL